MKAVQTVVAATMWLATVGATTGVAAHASADPVGPCGPQQLTVTSGHVQAGLGHRGVQIDFTLAVGAAACELSGYPIVDAIVDAGVDGAAPVHAEQTPHGYLGGATPGVAVTLEGSHGAHAMVEWAASGTGCTIYGPSPTDVRLQVTAPATAQAFTLPLSVGRNEGLCNFQVHPLVGD